MRWMDREREINQCIIHRKNKRTSDRKTNRERQGGREREKMERERAWTIVAFVQTINIDSSLNVGMWIKSLCAICVCFFSISFFGRHIYTHNRYRILLSCARSNEILSLTMFLFFSYVCVCANKFDKMYNWIE